MKKFAVLFAVLFVVALSGAAFAATGGHVNPTPEQPNVVPGPPDTTGSDPDVSVTGIPEVVGTPTNFVVANIDPALLELYNIRVQVTIVVDVDHTNPNSTLVLSVPLEGFTHKSGKLMVLAYNNETEVYDAFDATFVNGIKVTIKPVGDYFTKAPLVIVQATEVNPKKSGGGCNAGFAALALLALVPFVLRRR